MFSLKGITKHFGRQVVLSNVNLEVDSEIKALIGINGSGKSTLLKIMCGILSADQGTITINNRNVTCLPPEERNVGYVPQHPALFSHLSVNENIRYGMRNGRGSEEACERIIDMLDLRAILNKKPGQLSGGYQHRTSLARALAPQPEVLLLDEPLSGMDVVLKEKLLPEFREVLKHLGVPVLFVTHDPEEAHLLADSFAAIINGQTQSIDSVASAFYSIK